MIKISSQNNTGITLFKVGAIIILVQNVLYFIGGNIGDGSLIEYVLYIDLVGFLLLGLGYILVGNQSDNGQQFLFGGIGILGWLAARLYWQFVAVDNLTNSLSDVGLTDPEPLVDAFYSMVWGFLISALLLMVGAFFIWRVSGKGGLMFFSYAVVNFIAVFFIVQPFLGATTADNVDAAAGGFVLGFVVKLLVVPILGIITFIRLGTSVNEHFHLDEAA